MSTILDTAVQRLPMEGHEGRTGAVLERVTLADGTRLVVKRTTGGADFVTRLVGEGGRTGLLWASGVLRDLPPGVDSAVLEAWPEDGGWVIVMRDVSPSAVGWDRALSRAESRRVLAAAAAVHERFCGRDVPRLFSLADRTALFSPSRMRRVVDGHNPLPRLVLRGWEHFATLAPPDVAEAVAAVHERPTILVHALSRYKPTLIHGDLWPVNVALEPDRVVLLDWDLASWAPPALEVAWWIAGAAGNVAATRQQILDDFRAHHPRWHNEDALKAALFAGLVDFGWNKALDAAEHPDPEKRARETADLAWWVARGRDALDAGVIE
jgi:hypothetical protein